jgi:hypothetical protein
MILQSTNHVETSEKFEELTFGVRSEDMGIILEILRSKMYSSPLASICREIASNSRDANREVGKAALPIEIKIEDSPWLGGDLAICFKDAGPGISPDRIANVFVNYGASTKRTTNELTGGFGLGAKVPFSYADSFVIITVVDGMEYVYAAAIEEGRRGKLFMLNKQETTESNGTSIVVPIKSDHDRRTFESEVYNSTIQWDVVPKYVGFNSEVPKVETIFAEDKFRLIKGGNKESIALLIDGIYYPFDSDELEKIVGHHCWVNKEGYTLLLEFKIGDLTVSANRENVQYDKQTIAKLKERVEYFVQASQEEIAAWLRSSKNIVEAAIRLAACKRPNNNWTKQTTMYTLLSKFEKVLPVTFPSATGEIPIHTSLSTVFPGLFFQVVKKQSGGYRDKKRSDKESLDGDFLNLPLYWFDMTGLSGPRNRTIFTKHEEFLLVQVQSAFLEWKTLPFRRKKILVADMRKTIKSVELLKETLNPAKYSSIEGTSVERVIGNRLVSVETDTIIYGRVKNGYSEEKVMLHVEDGRIVSISGEGGHYLRDAKDRIFYVVADSLRPAEAHTLDRAYSIARQVQSFSNWHGLIINERGEKALRGTVTHYKVIVESKYEDLYNSLDFRIRMGSSRNEESIQQWVSQKFSMLKRFEFEEAERNRLLNTILTTVSEKKHDLDFQTLLQLVGLEYKSDTDEIVGYQFSERVKEWKNFLLGLKRKYPLAFVNEYSDSVNKVDIHTYVRAMDLLVKQIEAKTEVIVEIKTEGDTDETKVD